MKEVADLLGLGHAEFADIMANVDGLTCAGWEAQVLGPFGAVVGVWFRDDCSCCCEKRPGVGGPKK